VKPITVDPPSSLGGVKLIMALEFPAIADTLVGTPGAYEVELPGEGGVCCNAEAAKGTALKTK